MKACMVSIWSPWSPAQHGQAGLQLPLYILLPKFGQLNWEVPVRGMEESSQKKLRINGPSDSDICALLLPMKRQACPYKAAHKPTPAQTRRFQLISQVLIRKYEWTA